MFGMRILALVPEAFGGRGGIAQYNRDLLTALCAHPKCKQVVAVPRLARDPTGALPPLLCWVSDATGGRFRFCTQLIKSIFRGPGFDLIICCHINLLPLAWVSGSLGQPDPSRIESSAAWPHRQLRTLAQSHTAAWVLVVAF